MPAESSPSLVHKLKDIAVFEGLSPSQLHKVLKLCRSHVYEPGSALCSSSSASEEMFVLLSGQLLIKKPDGTPVVTVSPVATIGETSLVTRQPRAVDIEATRQSTVLIVDRRHFDLLLHEDPEMALRIFRNLVVILSNRFLKENVRACDFHLQKVHLALLAKKLEVAQELLAEKGVPAEESTRQIQERVKSRMPCVLVVDDEPSVRAFLKMALPDLDVQAAESGRAALEAMERHPPQLVLADINMPEMDGFELLHQVRARYPDIPVIGFSGFITDPAKLGESGFDAFLPKPFSLPELRLQVREKLKLE